MFAQIQLIQKWRKYQCIFVILSWLVNIAQNSVTWYSNFTDAAENVQFVCDDFHSTNYHISNCDRSNKIGVPKAFPPTRGLPEANFLRGIGTILTMLILYCAYKFRKEGIFYDKINHPELTVHMDIYNSGRMRSFMVEVFIVCRAFATVHRRYTSASPWRSTGDITVYFCHTDKPTIFAPLRATFIPLLLVDDALRRRRVH